jgi:thioredoxin reductase
MLDVIIVGGGPAGLNAALVLGRQRRRVVLFDDGKPRNAAVHAVHGFLSRDGAKPAELREIALWELRAYDTIEFRLGRVVAARIERDDHSFVVTLEGGAEESARKLLLATGLVDELPAIEGLRPIWGRSVFHCRYCDAWEVRDQPVAVLGLPDEEQEGLRQLLLALRRLTSDVVLCSNGVTLGETTVHLCTTLNVPIRRELIAQLLSTGDQLEQIAFVHGEPLLRRAAFLSPMRRQHSDLGSQIGCKLLEDGSVEIDDLGKTSVFGVYAAGDMARRQGMPFPYAQVVLAAGFGVVAAVAIDLELLREAFTSSS